MDLYAYSQIDVLDYVARANGIECPRLRGYRLMREQERADDHYTKAEIEEEATRIVENLCEAEPFWNPNSCCHSLCWETDLKKDYFLISKEVISEYTHKPYKEYIGVRWDRIHGWKRKVLKTEIHNSITGSLRSIRTFNKYVGRDDVLYIHARIGGGNWPYYFDKVVNQPWFIEKIDDCFDSTYCDIYAKIDPSTATEEKIKEYEEEAQRKFEEEQKSELGLEESEEENEGELQDEGNRSDSGITG